ncbi:hypothetical protein [Sphingobium sp. B2]|uniref:hypothetical protein n=1 Tax=Sphingobium sp. B2 TaxID=2583228 RepID=UPI00119CA85B|nr:hypothetical protein [Sphingobium sp. B2]
MKGCPPGAIWPAEHEESVQIREVYSRYGLAMYQAQVLEHGTVNALIVARMLPTMLEHPDRSAWEDAFDRVYDAELAKIHVSTKETVTELGTRSDLASQNDGPLPAQIRTPDIYSPWKIDGPRSGSEA